nr:hypothetical protein CFP56_64096 [Quercus suber]
MHNDHPTSAALHPVSAGNSRICQEACRCNREQEEIRPVIPESSLPYDKRTSPIVSAIAQVLGGDWYKKCLFSTSFSLEIRTLAYIMMFNLFPVKNLTNLSHPQALFLHDLYLKKDIDVCAHIYRLLAKCTVTRSKAYFLIPEEEEERPEGEDIASKGGNTDEDIDNFTLDPEDMEASPT